MRKPNGLWVSKIRDERELTLYVLRITVLSAGVALCLDVANQMAFFSDWSSTLHSWATTVLIAGGIAIVASRAIGRAQLALWRAKVALEHLSRTDPLTGLLNRRALFADDGPPGGMTLLIADIDRFKQVNDTHGHLVGDEVIRAVSRLMAEHLGDLGRVGRLGGEEFAFRSSVVSLPVLGRRLRAFRAAIEASSITAGGARVSITISGGIAVRQDGQSFEALYAAADRALYAAKASGRNRILVDAAGDCRDIDERADEDPARRAA